LEKWRFFLEKNKIKKNEKHPTMFTTVAAIQENIIELDKLSEDQQTLRKHWINQ